MLETFMTLNSHGPPNGVKPPPDCIVLDKPLFKVQANSNKVGETTNYNNVDTKMDRWFGAFYVLILVCVLTYITISIIRKHRFSRF